MQTTTSYQYEWHSITQLASYDLPKFEAGMSKKAKKEAVSIYAA